MEQPCGKRMQGTLPVWVWHLNCSSRLRKDLCSISAANIDRLQKGFKVGAGKKMRLPMPATALKALKALVEVRAGHWETAEVGWTEVDTAAH